MSTVSLRRRAFSGGVRVGSGDPVDVADAGGGGGGKGRSGLG